MTAKLAETIPSSIEYYEFNNQPWSDWPKWLQEAFPAIASVKAGKIATAHYETRDGEPEWYRWYDAEDFWRKYRGR